MTTRKYALKRDAEDNRDLLFASRASVLPESVDLRPKDAAAIFDQGSLGSCTANAICAFMSFLDKNYGYQSGLHFDYSRLFLYWQERALEGTVDLDCGATLRSGMKVAQQIGLAGELEFPYVVETFKDAPKQEAYDAAKFHRIASYRRLNSNNPQQLKESLAEGYPVVLGIELYESFESAEVARTGIVPFPDRAKEYTLGGHAVLAMGYTEDYIICRNSWGADWGDGGYFYLPMKFIGYFIPDMWTGR